MGEREMSSGVSVIHYLTMSLARDMNASPEVLIRSADASLEMAIGLCLESTERTVAINCINEVARGSYGRCRLVAPPLDDRTTFRSSGISI